MASIRKRVTKAGNVTYHVQVRRKGHAPETRTFERKTDAKNWAADVETSIRQNQHFKYAEAKKHTVGEAIDRYIEIVLPRKPKSAYVQHPQLLWLRAELGDAKLSDLHPPLITACRDRLAGEKVQGGNKRAPGTVNRYLAVLSHVFTVAMKEWGWTDQNPVLAVPRLKEPNGRTRYLTDDERSRILEACRHSQNHFLFPIVAIAIATGMRKGEILSLTWDNVDLTRGVAYLFETKNSEPRAAPLTGLVLDLLKQLRHQRSNSTKFVFPSPNGDWPIDIRTAWNGACRRAGLEDFKFHDLRHTTGSYLAMNGATPAEIAEVLGHKTYDMVKRYSHLSHSHTAGVVERMNEKVFGDEQA